MNDTTTSLHTFPSGTASDAVHALWKMDLTPTATTRAFGFYAGFPRETVIPETAKDWFEGTTVSPPSHAPASRLAARLEAYRRAPAEDRWPDAVWPDDRAFADAREFIERLPLSSIPMPEISLANDGEINFLWESDGAYVDLGFYGSGTYSYFARGGSGREVRGEDVPASSGLPIEIVELFSV